MLSQDQHILPLTRNSTQIIVYHKDALIFLLAETFYLENTDTLTKT